MPDQKELERLGGLFNLASVQSRPFLDRCSETKYLAVRDFNRARIETLKLTEQTLISTGTAIESSANLKKHLSVIKDAVESGQLDGNLVQALSNLRTSYLEQVLRPAIRKYLTNEDLKTSDLEMLYHNALRIDGLLEVVQFLKRIKPTLF